MSQTTPTGWRDFFNNHANTYDDNPFTFHTEMEVAFLLALYPVPKGSRFLDIGCGTGRHAIELAKRGFRVTGVDFSSGMLNVARAKARREGVEVEFVEADATNFAFDQVFDYAICLCEGGVGLVDRGADAEAHDLAIFKNIAAHLRPNAPFVLTALNGYSAIRQMNDELVQAGRFDPGSMISFYQDEWDLPSGPEIVTVYERLFIPPEVRRMLQESGFTVDNVYGGTAGSWGQRALSLDEVEAMYIARKR